MEQENEDTWQTIFWYEVEIYDGKSENGDFNNFFKAGDAVKISGASNEATNTWAQLEKVEANALYFGVNLLTVGSEPNVLTIAREIPPMDFICEHKNRLWGCSNSAVGEVWNAEEGEFEEVNSRVVYVSALGDPFRNAKITGEGLPYKATNNFSAFAPTETTTELEMPTSNQNPYQQDLQRAMDEYKGLSFSYDPNNSDAQRIKADYQKAGELSMRDTVAEVSARTNGLASSYAGQVGQQTYIRCI